MTFPVRKLYTQEEVDKLLQEQKEQIIRDNCNHDYGRQEFVDSCTYYRECRKCGHTVWGYERD